MKTTIKDDTLYVEIPLIEPRLSNTGKTFTIASTHGIIETDTTIKHYGEIKKILLNFTASVEK